MHANFASLTIRMLADHHQLSIILDTLGTPSIDDFYAINSQRSREYIRALPFRKKKNFSVLFPNANPLVRLSPCDIFCDDPSRRYSPWLVLYSPPVTTTVV